MARCRYMWCSCTSAPRGAPLSRSSATGMRCRSKTLGARDIRLYQCRSRHVHHHVLSRQGRNGCAVHTATMPRIDPQCRRRRHVTSRFCRLLPGSRMSRSPTNSGAGECFSSVTRRTRCPHSRPAGPTPRSRVRTIWRGSSPRSYEGAAESPLLDTFHAERHPVGSFNARQSLTGPTLKALGLDREGHRVCRPTKRCRCSICSSVISTGRPQW